MSQERYRIRTSTLATFGEAETPIALARDLTHWSGRRLFDLLSTVDPAPLLEESSQVLKTSNNSGFGTRGITEKWTGIDGLLRLPRSVPARCRDWPRSPALCPIESEVHVSILDRAYVLT
jgi:hypothetical protein